MKINIGIIGFGTVGKGAFSILNNIKDIIGYKINGEIVIKKIVDRRFSNSNDPLFSDRVEDILQDKDISIVVELIGGYEPAREFILRAIRNKKHVVTANKAVLAKYWDEIHNASRKNNVLVYFESSVCAGVPVIQGLNEGLAGNRIEKIQGILNGTTNYILTKMLNDGYSFQDALKMAQEKGFAESDPTFDIKGIDSAHKIAILASMAYGENISVDDVYVEGIDNLDLDDIKFAYKELGLSMKLLATAKKNHDSIELRVCPVFINKCHLLASVSNEYNAVYIVGDAVGDTMFYGKGAGELPAASGVVSDVIYIAKHIINGIAGKSQFVSNSNANSLRKLKINEIYTKYYLRFNVIDKIGSLAKITDILCRHNVSIATCFQKEVTSGNVPVIITTHLAKELDIKNAVKEINNLDITGDTSVIIRIED